MLSIRAGSELAKCTRVLSSLESLPEVSTFPELSCATGFIYTYL
jgi:hypothetical protein